MIIKLYDNEKYEYPLIEIKDKFFEDFEFLLKAYQREDEYNFDDFVKLIKVNDWFIRIILTNKEVFF